MSRLALVALALAAAAVLASCGGSSPSSSSGSATTGAGAGGRDPAAFAKFQSCLKDHGITLPARPPGGGNGQPPTGTNPQPPAGGRPGQTAEQRKAVQACGKYRPQGAGQGGGGGGRNPAAFTAYLTCLKDQGLAVDVKAGFNALRNLKRDDPKLQPALAACQSKLPQRPQGAPGASTTAPAAATT